MKMIAIILAVAASVVAQEPDNYEASLELKLNTEDSPVIGKLIFTENTENGISANLEFDNSIAGLNPGMYLGFVHENVDFSEGCNSTGQFVTYEESSNKPFLRPADITIHKEADKDPSVFVLNHATLTPGEKTSIIDRAIVFHERSVVEELNREEEAENPGLHHTSVFCGAIEA